MYSGAASGAVAAAAVLGAMFIGQHSLDHTSGAQRVDAEPTGPADSLRVEASEARTCFKGSDLLPCPEPVCECEPSLGPPSDAGSEGASTPALAAAAGVGASVAGAGLRLRGSRSKQ